MLRPGRNHVDRVVEAEIATVGVVVGRRHQQRVVEVRVERPALAGSAAGDGGGGQPPVPGVVRTLPYGVEARAGGGFGVEVGGRADGVDVGDADARLHGL